MKWFLPLVALGLARCTPDTTMFEATNTSSAHSKKDGVFLQSYRLSPAIPDLPVKEVFVEQRFMAGANPERLRLLDSTQVAANLVVVLNKPLELGLMHYDWKLVLADGVGWDDRRELTYCSSPGPLVLRFRLEPRPTFDNPTFALRLEFMQDSVTNIVKSVPLTARPL
ncbi:hypothetical protein [Hymenobacter arizonensis]|uniref:Uncharacterized protein n=1 Tax=Hymenobacter arizonensis TaxID=1227077 RepID=A0A1I6BRI1_HYMAR|nr:hypothetical protein [Hymenobacter arizonensis]SFQ83477.1 hypothetical protein SAMN04515668_4975 [Hymenobacter arizonensis]